jgi:hypothetical protein
MQGVQEPNLAEVVIAKKLPSNVSEMMMMHGGVVVFGPDYLENSLLIIKEMKDALAGMAILSCEKIDDLRIPSGPMLACSIIFFHRMPSDMSSGEWGEALLKGVVLRSHPPKGLGVSDKSPEDPTVEFVRVGGKEMQLILTWLRPLELSHCVQTARAIERSYLENGGQYGKAGVFKRLRNLLS